MPLQSDTQYEVAKILRDRHQFENEQMHKRLSWLGSFQSFLFAGLCLAWDKNQVKPLILIITLLGLAVALQAIFALSGVARSLIKIHTCWTREKLDERNDLGVFGLFQGSKVSAFWIVPWPELFIPIAFSVAWGSVLYVRFVRYS